LEQIQGNSSEAIHKSWRCPASIRHSWSKEL